MRACVCARASDGALVLVENMAATSRRRGGVPERLTGRFSRVPQDAAVWKGNGDPPVTCRGAVPVSLTRVHICASSLHFYKLF